MCGMKYIFIRNPAAGSKIGQDAFEKIKSSLSSNPDCEFITTQKPNHATEIAKEVSSKYGSDAVIFVCGGDGTLSEVATGLENTQTAIALLPMGTGNDFARKIYASLSLDEIIEGFGLYSGVPSVKTTDIDYISANGASCINVMSFGFDTKILKLANKISAKFPMLGSAAYKIATVLSLFGSYKFKARFKLDIIDDDGNIREMDSTRLFTLCAICNGSYYGGGFCPAADSLIDDGVINILIAKNLNLFQILNMIGHYIKGDVHMTHPHLVEYIKVKSGTVYSTDEKPLDFNRDGNPTSGSRVDFSIIPHSLKLAYFDNPAIEKALTRNK